MELREYWRVIRKRIILILIIPVIAAVVSGLYTRKPVAPEYTSSATILINVGSSSNMPDPDTMTGVVESQVFTQAVTQGYPSLTVSPEQLSKMISLGLTGDLVTFSATSTSRQLSSDVANDFANTFISEGQSIAGMPASRLLNLATPDLATPASTKSKKTPIELAAAIGLMIGLGLAFMLEYLDMRIKSETEMSKYLKIPVLGGVQDYRKKSVKTRTKGVEQRNAQSLKVSDANTSTMAHPPTS